MRTMNRCATQTLPPTPEAGQRARERCNRVLNDPKATEHGRQLALKELELLEVQGFFQVEEAHQKLNQQNRRDDSTTPAPPNSPDVDMDIGPDSQKRLLGTGPSAGHNLFTKENGFEPWQLPIPSTAQEFYKPNKRVGFFLEKPTEKLDDYWSVKLDFHPATKEFFVFLQKLPYDGPNKRGNSKVQPSHVEVSLADLQGGILDRCKELVNELKNTLQGSPLPSMLNHNKAWDVNYKHAQYWSPTVTISNSEGTFFLRPVWVDTCHGGMYNIAFHSPVSNPLFPNWAGPFGQMNVKSFVKFVNYIERSIATTLPFMELEIGAQELSVEDITPVYSLRSKTYVD